MDDLNPRAVIGANNPPDPIDVICAAYEGAREEAENWLDGTRVENEGQMKAVDALRKDMREWRIGLEKGQKDATAPLYDAYKAEGARWKPSIDDAKRIESGLVALVDGFKRRLAAEKAEAERKARAEAEAAMRAAREAAEAANAANIEQQRAAAEAQRQAEEAVKAAKAASKDTVKGLRTVTRTVVLDPVGLARALWAQDREAQLAFQADRARILKLNIPGVVEQRSEKEAF